jgi:hypothetical protein
MRKVSVLKIDNDCHVDRSWIRDYVATARMVCLAHGVQVVSIRMSRTNKGQHYYIAIQPSVSADKANRLQWLLRDDSRRVDYNRARIGSGYSEWNKLFEELGRRFWVLYGKVPAGTRKIKKEEISKNG